LQVSFPQAGSAWVCTPEDGAPAPPTAITAVEAADILKVFVASAYFEL
jgi:hypothetical protein